MATLAAFMQIQAQDRTVRVLDLDKKVDEDLLHELFTQAGPVKSVVMRRDRVSNEHSGEADVELATADDALCARRLLDGVRLFGVDIHVKLSVSAASNQVNVGAVLHFTNLPANVTQQELEQVIRDKIQVVAPSADSRVLDTHLSDHTGGRRWANVTLSSFEVADALKEAMNGHFHLGECLTVDYKTGCGTAEQRFLAQQAGKVFANKGKGKGKGKGRGP